MDLFGVGSMLGALADGVVGGLNYKNQQKILEEQKKQNAIDNEFRERTYKEQFDFSKLQYEEQKMREDNAVQRRAEDLEKAGINKLMAAGQAANAGSTVGTVSPTSGGSTNYTTPQLNLGIQQGIDTIFNALSNQQNISQSKTQQELIEAQILGEQAGTKKINKEIQNLTNDALKTDAERNKIISEMLKTDAERLKTEQQRQIDIYNYQKSRGMGLRTTDGIPSNLSQSMWIAGTKAGGN